MDKGSERTKVGIVPTAWSSATGHTSGNGHESPYSLSSSLRRGDTVTVCVNLAGAVDSTITFRKNGTDWNESYDWEVSYPRKIDRHAAYHFVFEAAEEGDAVTIVEII